MKSVGKQSAFRRILIPASRSSLPYKRRALIVQFWTRLSNCALPPESRIARVHEQIWRRSLLRNGNDTTKPEPAFAEATAGRRSRAVAIAALARRRLDEGGSRTQDRISQPCEGAACGTKAPQKKFIFALDRFRFLAFLHTATLTFLH